MLLLIQGKNQITSLFSSFEQPMETWDYAWVFTSASVSVKNVDVVHSFGPIKKNVDDV